MCVCVCLWGWDTCVRASTKSVPIRIRSLAKYCANCWFVLTIADQDLLVAQAARQVRLGQYQRQQPYAAARQAERHAIALDHHNGFIEIEIPKAQEGPLDPAALWTPSKDIASVPMHSSRLRIPSNMMP